MMNDTSLSVAKLQLHVDFPDIEEVWLDGYECANKEASESQNPYPKHSLEHIQWSEGWWAGFYGEEPLFELAGAKAAATVTAPETTVATAKASKPVLWQQDNIKYWITRLTQLAGALVASAAFYQLADIVA